MCTTCVKTRASLDYFCKHQKTKGEEFCLRLRMKTNMSSLSTTTLFTEVKFICGGKFYLW